MKFSVASTRHSNARKSVDFANQEGGLLRVNEAAKDSPSTTKGVLRFEDEEEGKKLPHVPTVAEDNNANVESLGTSTLKVSLPCEDEELKKTGDDDALLLFKSFDSAL